MKRISKKLIVSDQETHDMIKKIARIEMRTLSGILHFAVKEYAKKYETILAKQKTE